MTDTAPNDTDPKTPEGTDPKEPEGTPADDPKGTGKAPKFTGEFDADRAARLVSNLREEKDGLAGKIKALEAEIAEKGGSEKTLQDRLDALEKRAADAERDLLVSKVAKEHHVPDDLLEFLSGKDEATLKTQAERLAAYAKKPADDVPGKPKPKLTPGHGGDEEAPFDADAVAKSARRR